MEVSAVIRLPEMYPKQRAVFDDPAKLVVCFASTKSGKTVGALLWLISLAITAPMSYLYASYVYAQAEAMMDRVSRWLTRMDPEKKEWSSNQARHFIQFRNGARIYFKGADNPDSIYGSDYGAAVCDEASRWKPEAWYAVESTTSATNGPIRIIGNMKGRKNWAYQLGVKARTGTKNMAYFVLTADDAVSAGIMSPEKLERARDALPEATFRELYYAEPTEDGSNPFGLQHIAACVRDESSQVPAAFGCDLAQSQDWTVLIGLDAQGVVCDFDRWQGLAWESTEQRILGTIGTIPIAIDETGVGKPVTERIQRLAPRYEQVEGFTFSSRSKQQLMAQLAVAIQQRRVSFPDGPIRSELESFEFEHTASGVRYTAPENAHDDCVMALALAVRKLDLCANAPTATLEWADRKQQPVASREFFAEKRRDADWGFD